MHRTRRSTSDTTMLLAPLLLGAASCALAVIAWRRHTAPRRERRVSRAVPGTAASPEPDALDALDALTAASDIQHASAGSGALVHRQYEIRLDGVSYSAAALCQLMQRHIAELAPAGLAAFEKSEGSEQVFRAGDEYEITMLGPWNGTVRVHEVTPQQFTLVTLEGHPEAGQITFSAHDTGIAGSKRVLVESWARARDGVVQVAYRAFGIGRQVQTEVWITFLQRLAEMAGARNTPEVRITTEEISEEDQRRARDG